MDLIVCAACRRHVRATERACPFCASAIVTASPAAVAVPAHVSRAQRYALGAALAAASALGAAACKESPPAKSGGEEGTVIDVSADAGPSMPLATDPPPPPPPTATATATTPPRNVIEEDDPRDWRRNRPPCGGPKGPCPPYGCVFPDEACDVVSA